MNELIAKIYDECIVVEDGGDYVTGELDVVKFAQELIKECSYVALDDDNVELYDAILQKFGVEE